MMRWIFLVLLATFPAFGQGLTTAPAAVYPLTVNGWFDYGTGTPGTGSCATGTFTGTCIFYLTSANVGGSCTGQPPPVVDTPSTAIMCDSNTSLTSIFTAKIRTGKPDWILFKKGDVWVDVSIGSNAGHLGGTACGNVWNFNQVIVGTGCSSGLSCATPARIGSWPSTAARRPQLQLALLGGGAFLWNSGGDNVAINGIDFYVYKRDPNNPSFDATNAPANGPAASNNLSRTTCVIWEDLKVAWGVVPLSLIAQGAFGTYNTGLYINRIVSSDAWGSGGGGGALISGVCPLLNINQSVWNHNGWAPAASFNGTVNGTTLTVNSFTGTGNTISLKQTVSFTGVTGSPVITGTQSVNYDGTGTYTISVLQSAIGPIAMTAAIAGDDGRNQFSHGIYDTETGCGSNVTGNVFTYNSENGMLQRPGGTAYNNFFSGNNAGVIQWGGALPGVNSLDHNIVLDGEVAGTSAPTAITVYGAFATSASNFSGIPLQGLISTAITNNIIANTTAATTQAIALAQATLGLPATNGDTVSGNIIYNWGATSAITNTPGGITGLGAMAPGTGYVNGYYAHVAMTGGSCSGVFMNVLVSGGSVQHLDFVSNSGQGNDLSTNIGKNYQAGDILTNNGGIPGLTGMQYTITAVDPTSGGIMAGTVSNPGTGGVAGAGPYTNIPMVYVSGSMAGTGAFATAINNGNGQVTQIFIPNTDYGQPPIVGNIANPGTGCAAGNTLTTSNSNLGGSGSGFSVSVASVATNTITNNTICVSGTCTPPTTYPNPGNAALANYSSQVLGNGTTAWSGTGSITDNVLTTSTNNGLAVGQLLYGAGVYPTTYITGGSGTTWTVNYTYPSPISAEAMTTTPPDFVTCVKNNYKDAWNSLCTAAAINNWVRDQFGQTHVN